VLVPATAAGCRIGRAASSGGRNDMIERLLSAIERELLSWPGVNKRASPGGPGQGGFWVPPFPSYRFGRRELGHVHDTGLADLPFPRPIHRRALPFGVRCWTSDYERPSVGTIGG